MGIGYSLSSTPLLKCTPSVERLSRRVAIPCASRARPPYLVRVRVRVRVRSWVRVRAIGSG